MTKLVALALVQQIKVVMQKLQVINKLSRFDMEREAVEQAFEALEKMVTIIESRTQK